MITKPQIVSETNLVNPQVDYHDPLTITVLEAGEAGVIPQPDFWRNDIAIIDNDTIAAGAWGENDVLIYKRQFDDSWLVSQTISTTKDRFGSNIVVEGTVMAIGAETDSSVFNNAGGVYIYEYDSGIWAQTHFIKSSDLNANDRFGLGLAMQGNNLMAGAFGWDVTANQMQGAAYFFTFNGTSWVQSQRLLASDREQGDNFGRQLAMDGNWVAICAPGEDGPTGSTLSAGAVYMFSYGSTWTQTQKINAPDPQASGSLGRGLAILGDWLVIGEPGRINPTSGSTGKVYIYKNISGTWTYQQEFISDVDQEIAGGFGYSVSLTEDLLMVGKGGGNEVYIYRLYNGVWTFWRRLYETQNFGQTVALGDYFAAVMGKRNAEVSIAYAVDFERPDSYTRAFNYNLTKPTQTF